ncbi:MAG: PhoX family protein [Limisphaerales bacterium]
MTALGPSRRQFMQFLGASAVVAAGHRMTAGWMVAQAAPAPVATPLLDGLDFQPVPHSHADALVLPTGFQYEVLLRQGQPINDRGDLYGDMNDYLALVTRSATEGWLWVNHENAALPLITGTWSGMKTREHAEAYLRAIGGSCLRVRRGADGRWRPAVPDPANFRLDGLSSVLRFTGPAAGSRWLEFAHEATGSGCNCGGGVTPWGTFCSAEENFQDVWGDPEMKDQPALPVPFFFNRPAEHQGYIVEVDPDTRELFKHTALGRFSHENIAFAVTRDGRLAAYLGDDREDQCLYKFVSRERLDPAVGKAARRLLTDGTLHVADTVNGRWLPLDPARDPRLREAGFDLARIGVHTRTAAKLAGGTPLARPEDVEVHPLNGDVFVALTAHEPVKQKHDEKYFPAVAGAVARLRERDGDAGALEFSWEIFLPGSPQTGLAWPDNLAFTDAHHLLVCTDYSQKAKPVADSPQAIFGNNFLTLVPTAGPKAGQVLRLAVAPCGAEFCAPTLSPDRAELWVNVQHPGDGSTGPDALTSHWPDGGDALPRSALVAIARA